MKLDLRCTRLKADYNQLIRCKDTLATSSAVFEDMSKILALAGSTVRLKILFLLHIENELCPCDLADILGMSVPAVSQHLRKMKDAQIVSIRREGQTLFYSLVAEHMEVLDNAFSILSDKRKIA